MTKKLTLLLATMLTAISGYSQNAVMVNKSNSIITYPNNFWTANAIQGRAGLGLGSAATNPSSAFQPSSNVLSNLSSSNGLNVTNIQATNIVGIIPASNIATINISNITGIISIASGGTGATNAANARTNLGLSSAATNPSSAFQPSSSVLSNLSSGNAAELTNFPPNLLTRNTNNNVIVGIQNTNAIVFSNALTAAKFNGTSEFGTSGSLNMNAADGVGGSIDTSATLGDGNGGSVYTYAGSDSTAWGGNILTYGGSAPDADGGEINTHGSNYSGGSIITFDGGGSINTRGTGMLELGTNGTRTTLTGTATTNRSIFLPNASGTIALLTWSGMTNTNASNFRVALGATSIGNALFTATNSQAAIDAIGISTNYSSALLSVSNIQINSFQAGTDVGFITRNIGQLLTVSGTNVTTTIPAFYGFNGFNSTAFSAAESRTNLGLSWSALTNSNAGTSLVSVNSNGSVVSPTNFWQVAPINTAVQYSQPVVNATNAATNARNLYLYSLAISTVGVTNTITLPTNTATFYGDVATVIHEGPTNSVTAIRQIGSATNIISLNQLQEAVQFIYNGGGWKLADNISQVEAIYFSGTNAAVHAAESRTNLGIPLAALTNTNTASFQRAILQTNTTPASAANLNDAKAWLEISVVTNNVTNSFRIPAFQ